MCFFPPTMPLRILRPWRSTVFPPVCYGHHPPSRFCPCPPPIVGKHKPRAQMDWRQLVWSEHSKPAARWAANSRQHFEVEVWCPASLVSFCTYCWLIAAARNINTLPATRYIAQMDCPWMSVRTGAHSKNPNIDFQPIVSTYHLSGGGKPSWSRCDQIFGAATKVIPPKHHLMLVVTRIERKAAICVFGASSITCNCLASTHMKHFAFVGRLNRFQPPFVTFDHNACIWCTKCDISSHVYWHTTALPHTKHQPLCGAVFQHLWLSPFCQGGRVRRQQPHKLEFGNVCKDGLLLLLLLLP